MDNPEGHIVSLATEDQMDNFSGYLKKFGFIAESLHWGLTRNQQKRICEDFRQGLVQVLIVTEPKSAVPNAPFVFIFDAHQLFRACRTADSLLRIAAHATKLIAVCADTLTSDMQKVFPHLP